MEKNLMAFFFHLCFCLLLYCKTNEKSVGEIGIMIRASEREMEAEEMGNKEKEKNPKQFLIYSKCICLFFLIFSIPLSHRLFVSKSWLL
jgi:hypothetical protein